MVQAQHCMARTLRQSPAAPVRRGVRMAWQTIQAALDRIDMALFWRDVEASLRWTGRCRCAECERLREQVKRLKQRGKGRQG